MLLLTIATHSPISAVVRLDQGLRWWHLDGVPAVGPHPLCGGARNAEVRCHVSSKIFVDGTTCSSCAVKRVKMPKCVGISSIFCHPETAFLLAAHSSSATINGNVLNPKPCRAQRETLLARIWTLSQFGTPLPKTPTNAQSRYLVFSGRSGRHWTRASGRCRAATSCTRASRSLPTASAPASTSPASQVLDHGAVCNCCRELLQQDRGAGEAALPLCASLDPHKARHLPQSWESKQTQINSVNINT